jgi:membrane associated rhomboid family serine protease
MIPLRDVIPSRQTPIVTAGLIAANTGVFLYQQSLSGSPLDAFMRTFALVPADPGPLTLATSMFLHAGWTHLLGNMLYLWIFGDNIEDRLGHGRFLIFYLVCGLAASAAQIASSPGATVPIVGASGATSGVLGAYLVLFPRSRVLTLLPLVVVFRIVEIPAVYLLGFWLLLQLAGGLQTMGAGATGGVAFWAHAAGFVAGAGGVVLLGGLRLRTNYWEDQ